MNAKVIALLNEKGGVAKSTSATAIAYILAKQGKKVGLIDFDGQGHATLLNGVQNANTLPVTISTLLNKVIMDEPLPEPENYLISNNGVDLIPSNSQLFTLERNPATPRRASPRAVSRRVGQRGFQRKNPQNLR